MKQQLVITMMPDGSLKVEGPIEHKMLCYGMIEMARDLIKDYKPGKIVTANNGMHVIDSVKPKEG